MRQQHSGDPKMPPLPLSPHDIGVSLPIDDGLSAPEILRLSVLAEHDGYGTVLVGEVGTTEAFALLGAIATSTNRITIGSAVVGVGIRPLALSVMGFSTLAALAPGRVLAGLGVSSRAIVEGWHGRTFGPPLQQLEEFVPALREGLNGRRLTIDGITARSHGFRLDTATKQQVPLLLGALNSGMLELAGRIADGVILAWAPVEELAGHVRAFRDAATRAGRDPDSLLVLAAVFTHSDEHQEEAHLAMRQRMLRYSLSPGHRARFARLIPDLQNAQDLWHAGDRMKATSLIPDSAVSSFAVIGHAGTIVERLRQFTEVGVDIPIMYPFVGSSAEDVGHTITRVAEELSSCHA
jgi:alkanesulfonate monooxygenase SsuD/methylene tetrahydromethanopterin reductase-like flavin-dependent oxidoreductase (luciferase family)